MTMSTTCFFHLVTVGLLITLCSGKLDDKHPFNSLQAETPTKPASLKVIYAESHAICWTDVNYPDRLPPLILRPNASVLGLDYHYANRTLYFSGDGKIWSMQLNEMMLATEDQYDELKALGTRPAGEAVVVVEAAPGSAAVAVDWVRDRLYWSSPDTGLVWRAGLGGGDPVIVLRQDDIPFTQQNSLALDPHAGLLFLAVDGGGFVSADLDGRSRRLTMLTLVVADPLRGVTLAVDTDNRRLFLSGQQDYVAQLVSCGYDGSELLQYDLSNQWWDEFTSLSVLNDTVFWAHRQPGERDSVWKATIGEDATLSWDMEYKAGENDSSTRVWALKVFHPDVQRAQEDVPQPDSVINQSSQLPTLQHHIIIISALLLVYCK